MSFPPDDHRRRMLGHKGLRTMTKKTKQQSFRLSPSALEDLDWVANLIAVPNGLDPNRADAVRYAARQVRRVAIQLVGEIGAGPPKNVVADHDEYVRVNQLYPEGCVCYRVRGDSMNDELIGDGDFVVVRPCEYADNGATVAYHLADNGCVIKRYDKAKGQLFSGTGKGRWIHKLRDDDKLLGVYVGLIRRV